MLNLRKISRFILLLFVTVFLLSCHDDSEKNRKIPMAILVELMVFLDKEIASDKLTAFTKTQYENEMEVIKAKIMKHELLLDKTREYLIDLSKLDFPDLAAKAQELNEKLITKENFHKRWESVYGRVFESAFINELVQNPSSEVLTAMTLMGQGLGELLEREIKRKPEFELLLEGKFYNL
ncbi:MAG: hypothetical protein O2897_02195, partial [bacterium]|nr:hypothetical protein [bacterium]